MIQEMIARGLRAMGVEEVKVSPRERAMLAGLAAVGMLFGAIVALDWSEGVRVAASQARSERMDLERKVAQQTPGLTEQMLQKQVEKVRRMAFSDSTVPIARAAAQAQLERMANQAGVQNVRVPPEEDPAGEGSVKTQIYTIQGKFDWPSFLALVGAIAEAPQSIGVLSVSVDQGLSPTFAMKVRVPLVMERAG